MTTESETSQTQLQVKRTNTEQHKQKIFCFWKGVIFVLQILRRYFIIWCVCLCICVCLCECEGGRECRLYSVVACLCSCVHVCMGECERVSACVRACLWATVCVGDCVHALMKMTFFLIWKFSSLWIWNFWSEEMKISPNRFTWRRYSVPWRWK